MRFKGGIEAPYGNVDHIDEVGAKRSALAEYLGISSDDEITESDIRYLKALQEKVSEIVRGGYDISHSYVLTKFLNDSLSGEGLSMKKFEEYKQAASSIVNMRSFDLDWHSQGNIRRTTEHFKKVCEESHNDNVAAKNAGSPLKRIVTKGSALAEYLGTSSDDENEISHGRSR